MSEPLILIDETDPQVTILTLDRADKRNALSLELIGQITDAVHSASSDKMRRVILFRANGPAFCAGLDLNEATDPAKAHGSAVGLRNMYRAIATSPLITVAFAQGAAMGGGAGFLAACDLVVASADLKLGYPEVHRGLVAALVTTLLRRQLGERIVRELVLLGQTADAPRALALGLINRIGTFDDAMQLAHDACNGAPARSPDPNDCSIHSPLVRSNKTFNWRWTFTFRHANLPRRPRGSRRFLRSARPAGARDPTTRNMLYDVHTHVGLDTGFFLRGWWPYASTARDLLDRMDENRIGRAVCFPFTLPSAFDPYAFSRSGELKLLDARFPFDLENARLSDEIERVDSNKRLLQFAMFDPGRCVGEQVKSIEKLIGKIAGLKTQTTVLQSPIRALLDDAEDILHLAEQHDLPVLFHAAINPNDSWAQVSDCLEVAERFPKVRFNLAHSLRFHAHLLKQARQLANVWVDCSAHLNHCWLAKQNSVVVPPAGTRVDANYEDPVSTLLAVYDILGDRYMWGSDNPYMSWCDDKLRLLFTYKQEADVLHALPDHLTRQIASLAPQAWLFGGRKS